MIYKSSPLFPLIEYNTISKCDKLIQYIEFLI